MALFRILAVSTISTMKVDCPAARSSRAPMRVKMRSTMPMLADCRRHEAADLRQQHDQGDLPQIGRLPGHVRSGEDDKLGVVVGEVDIVGDESCRRSRLLSTTGCRPCLISIIIAVVKLRADVVIAHRHLRQRGITHRDAPAPPPAPGCARCPAATWRHTRRNRSVSICSMRSRAFRIIDSYSFSSGVKNRSPLTSVCLRI